MTGIFFVPFLEVRLAVNTHFSKPNQGKFHLPNPTFIFVLLLLEMGPVPDAFSHRLESRTQVKVTVWQAVNDVMLLSVLPSNFANLSLLCLICKP